MSGRMFFQAAVRERELTALHADVAKRRLEQAVVSGTETGQPAK